jgi:hypothetical protein
MSAITSMLRVPTMCLTYARRYVGAADECIEEFTSFVQHLLSPYFK